MGAVGLALKQKTKDLRVKLEALERSSLRLGSMNADGDAGGGDGDEGSEHDLLPQPSPRSLRPPGGEVGVEDGKSLARDHHLHDSGRATIVWSTVGSKGPMPSPRYSSPTNATSILKRGSMEKDRFGVCIQYCVSWCVRAQACGMMGWYLLANIRMQLLACECMKRRIAA